ncbi:omega-conotoxin-like protein 1 [Cotesia glomerata]|uniref:Uncharacterized protein n=1 Tax=Cotesia glomerata TaxID=32391 RepID=A0AAV7ITC5_COTGL|nr:omega-conotoxin-like protein 1 [Cotesia glomerata]KAH0568038.1 hypothetical protein KQX54_017903 [Cotesia glomerata]
MSKVIIFMFFGLLAVTIISARSTDNAKSTCGHHGDSCVSVSSCCSGLICHRFANRCSVVITPEELIEAKKNLKKTDSKFKDW